MSRYGIAEWYGEPFMGMSVQRRQELAAIALGNGEHPICPLQHGAVPCRKEGVSVPSKVMRRMRQTVCVRNMDPRSLFARSGLKKETLLADFLCYLCNAQVAPQPRRAQVGANLSAGLLDRVGRGCCKGVAGRHSTSRAN